MPLVYSKFLAKWNLALVEFVASLKIALPYLTHHKAQRFHGVSEWIPIKMRVYKTKGVTSYCQLAHGLREICQK